MMWLVYVGGIALLIGIIALSQYLKRKREQAMAQFAVTQGWQPVIPDGVTLGKLLPEALTNKGDNPQYDMAYSLQIGTVPATLFQYQYQIQTTEYDAQTHMEETRTQTYSYGVLTLTFSKNLASMFVQKHSFLSGLGGYEHQEKLQVEGDFNKHFEVYIPSGSEVEALSLLTPDVMALMEQSGSDFSVQITGQQVSIFGDDKYISPGHVLELVGYARQLEAKLVAKP